MSSEGFASGKFASVSEKWGDAQSIIAPEIDTFRAIEIENVSEVLLFPSHFLPTNFLPVENEMAESLSSIGQLVSETTSRGHLCS